MSAIRIALLVTACAGLLTATADGGGKLTIHVSPSVSMAPAYVVVRARVESDADNRVLEVTAESEDFYRSSQLPLYGSKSPRVNEVHFVGLPPGNYEVTATLIGTQGPRALVSRPIIVSGTPLSDRRQ